MKKHNTIIHISEVDITPEAGMGRVEYYWQQAFQNKKIDFIHIGPNEVGKLYHKALFPYKAYMYYKKLNIIPSAIIAHEPVSGLFTKERAPCFLESHGVESKYWNENKNNLTNDENISLKTRILYPLWRLYNCNKGLKQAHKLLLINSDDKKYTMNNFERDEEDIFLFKNGINTFINNNRIDINNFTILFNGSWVKRKGTKVLIEAAKILNYKGLKIKYLLIGTGLESQQVMSDWPKELWHLVTVIPRFKETEEINYLDMASIFLLPSFNEGQPLSLLQAMAAGKCCITTNCCGQKDLIEDMITGLLFEPGDYKKLSSLIELCYNDYLMTERIGYRAKQHVRYRTWEKVSAEVVDYVMSNI